MDFWTHLFDNEYRQRADIESLKQSSIKKKRRDQRTIQNQQDRIEALEDQVGELALLCRSLLTVLREDGTVRPERFEEVMKQMDAEDGVVDGKFTPEPPAEDSSTVAPEIRPWPKDERIR